MIIFQVQFNSILIIAFRFPFFFNLIMQNINNGGSTISWPFVAMFENATMRMSYIVCLT